MGHYYPNTERERTRLFLKDNRGENMASINKAQILGRLGRDPELKQTSTGKEYCSFRVATSSKYNGNETTVWHSVKTWGKLAEICGKYLKKGSQVYIEGRIDNREHEGKYYSDIVATDVQFLDSRKNSDEKPEVNAAYMSTDIPF